MTATFASPLFPLHRGRDVSRYFELLSLSRRESVAYGSSERAGRQTNRSEVQGKGPVLGPIGQRRLRVGLDPFDGPPRNSRAQGFPRPIEHAYRIVGVGVTNGRLRVDLGGPRFLVGSPPASP